MLAPTVKSKKPKAEKRKATSSVTTADTNDIAVVTNTEEYVAYLKELRATPYVIGIGPNKHKDTSNKFPFLATGLD